MAAFGNGPVLIQSKKSTKKTFRPKLRDDTDQALYNLFTTSATRAATKIRSDADVYLRYKRDHFLRELEESQSPVWIKLLPATFSVLDNPEHHQTTVEAALLLLNNMMQPICSSAKKIMKAAVQLNFVPLLINLISRLDSSSSKTMENACNLLSRIASIPTYREMMSECIPALLKIVQRRPNQLVVDSALSSLQNLAVQENFASQIERNNGVEIILHVLLDCSSVEAGCGTLANLAAHSSLRRKITYGHNTLTILLKLIQSTQLSAWMQLKAAHALQNVVTGETSALKECANLGGAIALEELLTRLQPRTDLTNIEEGGEEFGDNLLSVDNIGNIDNELSVNINQSPQNTSVIKQRKKPREPKWFANLLLRLKQSGRAMRRSLVIVNNVAEECRLGLSMSSKYKSSSSLSSNIDSRATIRMYTRALESTGFECTSRANTSKKQFVLLMKNFLQSIKKGDVVMLVFVGHGVSLKGENYLLPTDFPVLGRSIDVRTHALSLTDMARQITNRIGETGLLLSSIEASPSSNGGGEKFEPLVPMDVIQMSSHNNVCMMVSTMVPVSAKDGSTLSKKHLVGDVGHRSRTNSYASTASSNTNRSNSSNTNGRIYERDQRLLDYRQSTAYSYEICLALVSSDVEASAISKRVRRALVDCMSSYMEDGGGIMIGRLPWCNSSMIDDFYFNEMTTNPQTGKKERRNVLQRFAAGRNGEKKKRTRGGVSSRMRRKPLHQPSPPPRPPALNSPRTRNLSGLTNSRTSGKITPKMGSSAGGSALTLGGLNIKKHKKMTFGGHDEDTTYSLNRKTEYLDMTGTSKRINVTDFVAASGLGGNYAGADVAGVVRWTSTLRGDSIESSNDNSFVVGGGRGGKPFQNISSLHAGDIQNRYDDSYISNKNQDRLGTVFNRPGTVSIQSKGNNPRFQTSYESNECTNHNWIVTEVGTMECENCGELNQLEYSQSVFASSLGSYTPTSNTPS
jgi:hypothetical protein